jgi:hypothetical protein
MPQSYCGALNPIDEIPLIFINDWGIWQDRRNGRRACSPFLPKRASVSGPFRARNL